MFTLQNVLGRGRTLSKARGVMVDFLVQNVDSMLTRNSAMPAMPGSKVFTNTPLVHEARFVTFFFFVSASLLTAVKRRCYGIPSSQPSPGLPYL